MKMPEIARKNKIFYLLFAIIIAVNLFAFYPSFSHLFRSDHIYYLAETRHYDDAASLWKNFFAYEHIRQYSKGDTLSFRPLLFIIIGAEKAVFGANYTLWHITGFVIHIIAVWFLFKLLLEIENGIFAVFAAGLFSSLYCVIEAVIWEHINAYVVFVALVLASLYYLLKYVREGQIKKSRLFIIFILMSFACFLYENGCVFSILFTVFLWLHNVLLKRPVKKGLLVLLVLPALIYMLSYAAVNMHYGKTGVSQINVKERQEIFNADNLKPAFKAMPASIARMLFNGFFPAMIEARIPDMTRVFYGYPYKWISPRPIAVVNYAAIIIAILSFLLGLSTERIKRNWLFMSLIAAMILSMVAIFCFARVSTHGLDYILNQSSYYAYMFWGYFCLLFYAAVDRGKFYKRWRGALKYFCLAAFTALILINIHKTNTINLEIKDRTAAGRAYVRSLGGFIEAHNQETDFSFFVTDDPVFPFPKGHPRYDRGAVTDYFGLSELLYFRYVDKEDPKFLLTYDFSDGTLIAEKRRD